jgi:DNA-binding MarR family transcriptional regulator
VARRTSPPRQAPVPQAELEAVVDATRVVGALIAESLASVEPPITMPQWRVLVLALDSCNLTEVAEDLHVHPSNATRICDRLVNAGLLRRTRAKDDRRQVLLVLTAKGRRLYNAAMKARTERVAHAMAQMRAEERIALAHTMAAFSAALISEHDAAAEAT